MNSGNVNGENDHCTFCHLALYLVCLTVSQDHNCHDTVLYYYYCTATCDSLPQAYENMPISSTTHTCIWLRQSKVMRLIKQLLNDLNVSLLSDNDPSEAD